MQVVTRNWFILVYLIGASWMVAQVAPSSPASTVIKAGRLLDPRTGNVLSPAAVLIEGNKIKQVGPPSQINAPAGVTVIDLGGATLLPGLIDGHTHLFLDIIVANETEQERHANGLFAPP